DLGAGDAPARQVRLSELFSAPGRSLVIYHLMYGKRQTTPCPMCTMWIDGFNGVAHHLAPNVDFAIAAAADLADPPAHAPARGRLTSPYARPEATAGARVVVASMPWRPRSALRDRAVENRSTSGGWSSRGSPSSRVTTSPT